MTTLEEATDQAKKIAKRDKRIMCVRNDYGNYSAWYHYEPGREGQIADAGATVGGLIVHYVYPDGTISKPSRGERHP